MSNLVTVPEDKLAELQRKAKLVDELVDFLKDLQIDLNHYGYGAQIDEQIDMAIAKAKIADHIRAKDKVCSTLCHPDEECSITENGKCEAKGE